MQAVLAGEIQGCVDRARIPRHATDVHQTPLLTPLRPVSYGHLAQPYGRSEIDVQDCIVARLPVGIVPAGAPRVRGRLRRVPEVGPLGIEETCAGNDNVDGRERRGRLGPEGRQLGPRRHVGLVEEGAGPGLCAGWVLVQQRLGFSAALQVS